MSRMFASRIACYAAVFSVLAVLAFTPLTVQAAAAPKGGNTRILSEKMTYDSAKNQVVFEGKVHVTRPDMEIWSEVLTLVLDSSEKKAGSTSNNSLGVAGGGKVERIIAEKNVRIKQGDKSGTCGKATYYVNAGKIVMEYNPVLIDGSNKIRGSVINYFTASGRSEVINPDVVFSTGDSGGKGVVFQDAAPVADAPAQAPSQTPGEMAPASPQSSPAAAKAAQ
ncbi:MAG: Lipopolysaccharide export system protein LptA [Desulfovibrio sp.]